MGFVSIGMTMGSTLGPLLGGVIYERAGYVAVFILAFGVIGFDVMMRLIVIEKQAADQWKEDPVPGQLNVITNNDVEGQMSISSQRANDGTIRSVMTANATATIRRKESRVPALLLLLKSPRHLNSLYITIMLGTIFTSFDAVLPIRVKHQLGFGPTAAGLIFLAIIIPSLIAPLGGRLSDKYGPRWFVVAAFLISAPLFILLRFPTKPEARQIVLLCALLGGIGFVIAACLPGAMGEISASVVEFEKKDPGIFGDKGAFAQAYALFNIAWSVGSVVGPLLGGFLHNAVGWNNLVLILGILCLLASFVTMWYTGGKITKKDLPWNWNWRRKQQEEEEEKATTDTIQESEAESAEDRAPSDNLALAPLEPESGEDIAQVTQEPVVVIANEMDSRKPTKTEF